MRCFIDLKIENNDEKIIKKDIKAIKNNDKLNFNYDTERIKIKYIDNSIIMEKENNESKIIFNFKLNQKTQSQYYIKDLNFYIDTEVITNKLIINDDKLIVHYDLWLSSNEAGSFKYEIDIKEVI